MSRLARDLGRWEAGELRLGQVELAHPTADPRSLADLFVRLSGLLDEAVPDPEASWSALRDRLVDRPVRVAHRTRRRLLRPAALALAAVLATGTVAYAAGVEPVRRVVDRAWDALTGLFDGEHEPASAPEGGRTPGPEPRPAAPAVASHRDWAAAGGSTNGQVQDPGSGSSQDEAADQGHHGSHQGGPDTGKGDAQEQGTVAEQGTDHEGGDEVTAGDDDEDTGSGLEEGAGGEDGAPEGGELPEETDGESES